MSETDRQSSAAQVTDNPSMTIPELDRQKLEIERGRLELDASFPRKWGSVIFGMLGTITVAIITVGANLLVANWQAEETGRVNRMTEARIAIENARNAIHMYFEHLDAMSPDRPRALNHMKLITEISDHEGVRGVFLDLHDEVVSMKREQAPELETVDIVSELPSPSVRRPDADGLDEVTEGLPPHTAYVHYPRIEGRQEFRDAAEKVASALRNMGMRVPGLEGIPEHRVPNNNQVRFYSREQSDILEVLPSRLEKDTSLKFQPQVLQLGRTLPEGIFEVWVGRHGL